MVYNQLKIFICCKMNSRSTHEPVTISAKLKYLGSKAGYISALYLFFFSFLISLLLGPTTFVFAMLPRLSTFGLRTTATKHVWKNHFKQHVFARTPQRASLYTTANRKPLASWSNQIPKRVLTTSKQSTVPKTSLSAVEKKLVPPAAPIDNASNTKRNATDWAIIKQLMKYIWPKNDVGVKTRVVIALSLLVGGKVNCIYKNKKKIICRPTHIL